MPQAGGAPAEPRPEHPWQVITSEFRSTDGPQATVCCRKLCVKHDSSPSSSRCSSFFTGPRSGADASCAVEARVGTCDLVSCPMCHPDRLPRSSAAQPALPRCLQFGFQKQATTATPELEQETCHKFDLGTPARHTAAACHAPEWPTIASTDVCGGDRARSSAKGQAITVSSTLGREGGMHNATVRHNWTLQRPEKPPILECLLRPLHNWIFGGVLKRSRPLVTQSTPQRKRKVVAGLPRTQARSGQGNARPFRCPKSKITQTVNGSSTPI